MAKPRITAKFAFFLALILLCISGIGATYNMIRLYSNESWVRHSYGVEVAIGDVESALAVAGRQRIAYTNSGTDDALEAFRAAVKQIPLSVNTLRQLTRDNAEMQVLCDRLEVNANRRVAPMLETIEIMQHQRQIDPMTQLALTSEVASAAQETGVISQQMRQQEDVLLKQRSEVSTRLFSVLVAIVAGTLTLSALMFWLHYTLINREIRELEVAEDTLKDSKHSLQVSEASLRELSLQLLRAQDEERGRLGRELHDSVGQYLSMLKMKLDGIRLMEGEAMAAIMKEDLEQCAEMADDAIKEVRTISYLLFPPMLDEMGLKSAITWYAEGFAKRSGIRVGFEIASEIGRLPRDVEIALFRVLQESLTNVHRHSGSQTADIRLWIDHGVLKLEVADRGKGIPAAKREDVSQGRMGTLGVGLRGMSERVQQLGGKLEMTSGPSGTTVIAIVPTQGTLQDTEVPA